MVSVEIEYRSVWGTLADAQNLGRELLDSLGEKRDGVEVTNRKGDVFRVDGDVVYEDEEEHPMQEAEEAIRERLAGRDP